MILHDNVKWQDLVPKGILVGTNIYKGQTKNKQHTILGGIAHPQTYVHQTWKT